VKIIKKRTHLPKQARNPEIIPDFFVYGKKLMLSDYKPVEVFKVVMRL